MLYEYGDVIDSFWSKEVQKGVKKLMPEIFEIPFATEAEKNAIIASRVTKSLNKIISYERRAISRRNKAIRAFDEEKFSMPRAETQEGGQLLGE